MTQRNRRGATGVMPGAAEASAYAPLRQPVFRALWIASLESPTCTSTDAPNDRTNAVLPKRGRGVEWPTNNNPGLLHRANLRRRGKLRNMGG